MNKNDKLLIIYAALVGFATILGMITFFENKEEILGGSASAIVGVFSVIGLVLVMVLLIFDRLKRQQQSD